MSKNVKHITLLILTFALVLFTLSANAQEVRVIDNKGTIQKINNNVVKTSDVQSTPASYIANVETTYSPIENDTFIYKPATGEKVYYVFDGTEWNMIAPTKAVRVFYPPSIVVPASTTGAQAPIDLYDMYSSQFTSPIASSDATATIPIYQRNELYYFVTEADATVFDLSSITISSTGVLNYSVSNIPTDDNAIINVVFVVK
ncbi:hypothetical protein [Tenacibaculum aestuarii]|uniref:hypothetical protein n=1 Tax=Tenacibaculum aestuarii TaxID=362781 RepID=UPI0038960961